MAGAIALVHSQVQEGGEAVKQDDVMACFVWFLLGMTLGGIAGVCTGVSQMKQEAVREGHAEWVSDQNGKPQFKWKECK